MVWSASAVRRVLIAWPLRRPQPAARRRGARAPYRDVYFADPYVVEDDYQRMRRR
jgi:hypothetical protein